MSDYEKLQYAKFASCRLKISFPLQFTVGLDAYEYIYRLFTETYRDLAITSKKKSLKRWIHEFYVQWIIDIRILDFTRQVAVPVLISLLTSYLKKYQLYTHKNRLRAQILAVLGKTTQTSHNCTHTRPSLSSF